MPYFDNAATTFPKPEVVYGFMDRYYRENGVNVGRGQHKLAFVASNLVNETRERLLALFHCLARKVVFTHTATEALNVILQGLDVQDGSNIYLSPFEHNAVTRVIHYLGKTRRLNVRVLDVDKRGFSYDIESIANQFAENKPHVVVISHASTVCGVVAPIAAICRMAKAYGAVNVVDMAQTAGLIDTDLSGDVIDFAVFAGHKTLYGPLGVAGFVCGDNAKNLKPLIYGGTGVDSASMDLPDSIPERFEVASPNIIAIAGLHAALGWISEVGIQNIYAKEQVNRCELLRVLGQFDNIQVVGGVSDDSSVSNFVGVVSCVFDGYSADSIGQVLSQNDIAVRTGLHCAPNAHRFLGTFPAGTVRFSVGYFNDARDFEQLEFVLDMIRDNS